MVVTIDGKQIEAREGQTILELARSAGISIPTLCYLEKVDPIGSCGLCVIEVEGEQDLLPACSTVVRDGMVVTTRSERIETARLNALKVLLEKHPLDCPVCDKAGECRLQDLVYELGYERRIADRTVGIPMLKKPPVSYSTPAIKYYPGRCVLCRRCVTVCSEYVGQGVLVVEGENGDGRIEVAYPEKCISCGECLAVCPVGALTENVSDLKARPWQKRTVRTVCPYCGVGCVLELNVAQNRVIKVTVDESVPPNYGTLCVKGRFGFEFVNSSERLTKPLIRKDDDFVEASWDEALDFVADKLRQIVAEHGPDAVAGLASAKCTNEDNYVFQKFMRAVIGTNNVDHCARL
ncbi:4Fe-4S dicluster domain-containing protein [Thermodesulforhabdus norvegica]|uniref:4Fe-4S dicluster domain-containing protein n=3 Tax=Thermodesulforhabdus norvegica TaxID=39841 RepID=A0A1I4UK01_9BACT|nr:4Fe-4S dicluster domain-containing protein [Thermodesulforhabdus norvegica]